MKTKRKTKHRFRLPKKLIHEYYEAGKKHQFWYEQTRQSIEEMFFEYPVELVIRLLAVTSAHASLKSNVALFYKALYQYENGLEFKGYTPAVIMQLEAVAAGEMIPGRKLRNFANAIIGDPEAIVVDIWILRACQLKKKGDKNETPSKREYDHVEKMFRKYAKNLGVEPRQFCAAVWAGVRQASTGNGEPVRYCDVLRSKIIPDLFSNGTRELTPKGLRV